MASVVTLAAGSSACAQPTACRAKLRPPHSSFISRPLPSSKAVYSFGKAIFGRGVRWDGKVLASSSAPPVPAQVQPADLERCVNTIRFLALDSVEKAGSGHPGLPMGCATLGLVLWNEIMKYNPKNPKWFNRDRFVLSAGHGCMLQYAMLHLTGYDSVTMDDLKHYRQWGSPTPGHPENVKTDGIEVATGPLGQGFANAVGIAAAEKHLAARYNRPGLAVVDHYTYVIMGDGCMMEGVTNEAASLAGHWGLDKLIVFYDDNSITIDGSTSIAFSEDVGARYAALGWHVQRVDHGETDYGALRDAVVTARGVAGKPKLIITKTVIGYGAPHKAATADAHGSALGKEEVEATRKHLGWQYAPFEVPGQVEELITRRALTRGAQREAEWGDLWGRYQLEHPQDAAELGRMMLHKLPEGEWWAGLPRFTPDDKPAATRSISQACLGALADALPGMLGGSADLASSNKSWLKKFGYFGRDTPGERNIGFGVREHAMGAICNGLKAHSPGLMPYCATFLTFSDYMRASMRLAALSKTPVLYVLTHDSIGLGGDGPTHQPVEHLAALRAMPNLYVFRPADGNETSACYKKALEAPTTPCVLALSRQNLPQLAGTSFELAQRGGYVVSDSGGRPPELIFIATGSEVWRACEAAEVLRKDEHRAVRVVSMPCVELFEEQLEEYKQEVLPDHCHVRCVVEAGRKFGWAQIAGPKAAYVTVETFGASAPADVVFEKFGFGIPDIVAKAKALLHHL